MAVKDKISKTTTSKTTTPLPKTTPASTWKKDLVNGVVATLALSAALSFSFVKDFVIDAGLLLGPVQPFNTEGCKVVQGLEACEDIHIHHASGIAFTTCGNAEARKSWYPPIGKNNASTSADAFQDKFVIYNVASGKYDVKELVGLPSGTDRVFHGMDIYERSPTEFTIFAVNHRRTGSVIEVLEYSTKDKVVRYKETIQHDLIHTPNDIVALGPRSFYVSNDHRHKGGHLREVEDFLRRRWGSVIYYSPETTFVAFDNVASANGMAANPDRSRIFLSACFGAGIHVLEPSSAQDPHLIEQEFIKLDFFVDNPSYDPSTGNVLVTGHVKPLIMKGAMSVFNEPVNGPSKIVKLSPNPLAETSPAAPLYLTETVVQDDGQLISTGTVAALDRKRGVMLVGAVFSDRGLIRCPVPKGV